MTWPQGVRSAGVAAGIKPAGDLDLGLIVTEQPVEWAGTFTRNAAAAAPVLWCKGRIGSAVRAIVVNSGNANACTGAEGVLAVERATDAAAVQVGCSPTEVLVASTGPIGIPLPVERIESNLAHAFDSLVEDPEPFARSIITTDTHTKVVRAAAGDATVVGVAKGAAMLAPNMATMLAFIVTDAAPSEGTLQPALTDAVRVSFDRISVDACESTNDSVFLLATGKHAVVPDVLSRAVTTVCRELAEMMVRDAEGGSKFVRILVTGATDDHAAAALGKAVAASALWRAAVNGGDPNWGRVLSALGSHDRSLVLDNMTVAIGAETVFDKGQPIGSLDGARKAMDVDEFELSCVVGHGSGAAEVLSCDLSTDYVRLNADGST
ncbi:MAG: glutamate N-acetyltransferase / amino-acid N-acetyltransferase [Actinomycetota bacterium]|nr:glutamate N-acetyltransferase / amino-acid N-acetyltransferase [Actinomycetota bacterium]